MTTTVSAADDKILDGYLEFWNTDPGDAQARIASEVFVAESEYHAVIGRYTGVAQLQELRPQFVEHLGELSIRARGPVDRHHDRARLPWELVLADGTSFAEGTDVIRFADDGRIAEVTVFLDRAPEGFGQHH